MDKRKKGVSEADAVFRRGTEILHAEFYHLGGFSMHLAPVRTGGKNAM